MKILITGTEGYIGARLAPWLTARGHQVTGLDTGFYRDGTLYLEPLGVPTTPVTIYKDLRAVTPEDFRGFDAVVHLAELSNDPLGQNRPEITFRINHEGSVRIATLAKAAGVRRFVYASSCSVYGVASGGDYVDETTTPNPQSTYAQCKVLVERDVAPMASPDFAVTFLRNATAYGASPRMRFDIVLNDLSALAWTQKKIAMVSDGSPWRPIVHVEDICEAVRCVLDAPVSVINGQILNVGATRENYRIREIAQAVAGAFPGCAVSSGPPSADNRSYRVSFAKIEALLPDYKARWTAQKGAEELCALFKRIEFDDTTYKFRAFTRLKQLQYLQRTRQIDEDLYWRAN
jgi:nucleoside-diphosphate-sugar epimerase